MSSQGEPNLEFLTPVWKQSSSMAQKRGEQLIEQPSSASSTSALDEFRIKISLTDRVTNEMLWERTG